MTTRGRRSVLKRTAGRWPREVAAAADLVAAATYRLRPGMEPDAIARLLPHLDGAAISRVRQESWAGHLRMRAWEGSIDAPRAPSRYAPVELKLDPAALEPPMVLALFHLGPTRALRALFDVLPARTLLLARSERTVGGLDVLRVTQDPAVRAACVARAIRGLRDGRFVAGAVDTVDTAAEVEAALFGRAIRLARGPFAIARLARVPLVPVATTWDGRRPAVLAGRPISSSDEPELIAQTARWLEEHLGRHPGDISPRTLRDLA